MKKEFRKNCYEPLRKRHADAILLFRIEDFYNAYLEDAEKVAEATGIACTTDEEGDYHAFFSYADLDTVLPKLILAGHRVVIYDYIGRINKMTTSL